MARPLTDSCQGEDFRRFVDFFEAKQLIRFENVGIRYGMSEEVLRDVSFHLEPGSFHFLVGSSGAGKTSLLNARIIPTLESRDWTPVHITVFYGKLP